jgi:hypothetical protein
MSIAELKAEVDRLTPEERKQLASYIVAKNQLSRPEVMEELSRKIDDNDPLTLEEFGKRLGLNEHGA